MQLFYVQDKNQYISKCLEKLHRLLKLRNTGGALSYSPKSHADNTSVCVQKMTISEKCNLESVSSEQEINEPKTYEGDGNQILQSSYKKLTPLKEKMSKLEKYGEPPSLTPITIRANTKLKQEFRCPTPVVQPQKGQNIAHKR